MSTENERPPRAHARARTRRKPGPEAELGFLGREELPGLGEQNGPEHRNAGTGPSRSVREKYLSKGALGCISRRNPSGPPTRRWPGASAGTRCLGTLYTPSARRVSRLDRLPTSHHFQSSHITKQRTLGPEDGDITRSPPRGSGNERQRGERRKWAADPGTSAAGPRAPAGVVSR